MYVYTSIFIYILINIYLYTKGGSGGTRTPMESVAIPCDPLRSDAIGRPTSDLCPLLPRPRGIPNLCLSDIFPEYLSEARRRCSQVRLGAALGANLVPNGSRNRSQDPPQDLKISRSNIDAENDQNFNQKSKILGMNFDVVLNRFPSRFCFLLT